MTERSRSWGWGVAARRGVAFVCAVAVAGVPALLPAGSAAASPAAAGDNCVQPGTAITGLPWAQQMLAPQRAWSLSDGTGVKVAVIDSGVDGQHKQLRNAIAGGIDLIAKGANGLTDCVGHGTGVAAIIAARPFAGIEFEGIAPNAKILSARVNDAELGNDGQTAGVNGLAQAIDWAIGQHAGVINISMTLPDDSQTVREAIARAVAADVVVVAAAGNRGSDQDGDPRLYPASYPGVIGVGAIDETGKRTDESEYGDYIDLVAPGANIITAQAGGGLVTVQGTSFSAAFVSGAAALVRGRFPNLSAAEVARRLYASATPAPGGPDSDEYGYGIVNPYGAITDQRATRNPGGLPGMRVPAPDPATLARKAAQRHGSALALALTGGGLLAALLVLATARVLPAARRRRWTAGLTTPRESPEDEQPSAPIMLFEEV
jgi:type VII secretion-associated serine protease mycosin